MNANFDDKSFEPASPKLNVLDSITSSTWLWPVPGASVEVYLLALSRDCVLMYLRCNNPIGHVIICIYINSIRPIPLRAMVAVFQKGLPDQHVRHLRAERNQLIHQFLLNYSMLSCRDVLLMEVAVGVTYPRE